MCTTYNCMRNKYYNILFLKSVIINTDLTS